MPKSGVEYLAQHPGWKTKRRPRITDKRYVSAAKRLFNDPGTIEIDNGAIVSRAPKNPDKGAYVQAWVWVDDVEARIHQEASV